MRLEEQQMTIEKLAGIVYRHCRARCSSTEMAEDVALSVLGNHGLKVLRAWREDSDKGFDLLLTYIVIECRKYERRMGKRRQQNRQSDK